jgi:hypothetical protein
MIHQINASFEYDNLVLKKPHLINGSYMIKFLLNEKPLYIQFPQSKLKSGIQKSGKKHYCDLLFSNQNEQLIDWMENLEIHCKKTIFTNRAWFESDLEEDDIDAFFTSTFKSFKSGKFYTMRTHVPADLAIYDESGENKLSFDNVNDDTNILTIIEVIGIKCSDKNFQIETEVKQMLLVKEIFDKCLIKVATTATTDNIKEESKPKVEETPLEEPFSEVEKIIEQPMIESINLEELVAVEEKPIKINKRNDIYEKMYKEAKEKAKIAKKMALLAYLEAKRIKNEYMIDDINDSENEDD